MNKTLLFQTMFWLLTNCWIWQQCWNCVQRHLQTLRSKPELTQEDFVVLFLVSSIIKYFKVWFTEKNASLLQVATITRNSRGPRMDPWADSICEVVWLALWAIPYQGLGSSWHVIILTISGVYPYSCIIQLFDEGHHKGSREVKGQDHHMTWSI